VSDREKENKKGNKNISKSNRGLMNMINTLFKTFKISRIAG
jgi:hypothetical protein